MTDTATSQPTQGEAPQPAGTDVRAVETVSDGPAVDQPAADDDRDAPDLSLKTPGLSDKNNHLKVELAEDASGIDQTEFYSSDSTFEGLGLSKQLLDGLYTEMGFKSPSSIQATTLPLILAPPYRHLIAQGHNGCGKTTCFALAMLSRVDPGERMPQAICMCPTRELVVQNLEVVRKMGKYTGIEAVGVNELRMGRSMPPVTAQIVIGTAGRITNLISSRKLVLDAVRVLVFDEADEMMKVDGFKDTSVGMIQNVRKVSEGVQILLFSATFGDSVKSYVTKIMPSAHKVFVEKEQLSLDVIKQYRVDVSDVPQKDEVLKEYIIKNADRLGQTIIFVASRKTAQALYQSMLNMGVKCLKLSGDMLPEARDQAVLAFRQVHAKILIATDVIARGFDVSTVTLVVNYDLPVDNRTGGPAFETYLHRIGRSGRFGRKGAAFNFVNTRPQAIKTQMPDVEVIEEISRYFNREIPSIPADGEEAFIQVLGDAGLAEQDD